MKKESVKRIIAAVNDRIKFYRDAVAAGDIRPENIDLCVSMKNSKVPFPNVSLAPVITCPNCAGCIRECYALKDFRYPSITDARARNTFLALYYPAVFFRKLWEKLDAIPFLPFFRFHEAGDIPGGDAGRVYVAGMIETARRYPGTTFWTYTKNHAAVNAAGDIPENLVFMRSPWPGCNNDDIPAGAPCFHVVTPGDVPPADMMQCPGNCGICAAAHIGCTAGASVWTYKH